MSRTHNHLVRERTINHLAKLVKLLDCVVSTYLYGAFDFMLLSCHVRTRFRVNPHSVVRGMSRNSLLEAGTILVNLGTKLVNISSKTTQNTFIGIFSTKLGRL